MIVAEHMLTTSDNPHDPFTAFDEWFAYDSRMGYNTPSYLARITRTSDELSEEDQSAAIDDAINEIVELNINGLYVKVTRPSSDEEE